MARRSVGVRRNEILFAARDLFNRHGYARTSMNQIAEKAGIAHGTIYFYFDSKLAVADALVNGYIRGVSEILEKSLSDSIGPEQIRTCVHNVVLYASKNSDIIRLMDIRCTLGMDSIREPDASQKLEKILVAAITRGISRGRLREYDPLLAAKMVTGIVEWVARMCLMWMKCDTSRLENTAIQMLEHALIKS
ncbi:MAG: TetR/AcrR family transcriptional regulator [Dehalococcoidia bacterium]|nr:TetR/AcrR family transcriptional regulator [Dehalococcoidia bacterium]